MFKRIWYVFLWTLLLVNILWVSKDSLPYLIEFIEKFMDATHKFKDAFIFSFIIFMCINVTFIMVLCVYKIIYNLLVATDLIDCKPKITQMSMYIDEDGYINKSYFITVDNKKIPVKVYQHKEQKVEVQADE